ncbi:MAG: tRNA (guanosine(46)-N7)-methyltransferase TrmB, partial [Bacteroidetes bacterium]|nr:tRNA (guanosine(46)-N7)-methyltransferase TrmB [Bacteroidota bacterium]
VSEIWITFPDPQPRQARERKRLTAPRFLQIYKVILKEKGLIHLKTDNLGLFNYSLEVISGNGHHLNYATSDLYQAPDGPEDAKAVQTFYEKMFLEEGKPICYLAFTLNNTPVHHESPG